MKKIAPLLILFLLTFSFAVFAYIKADEAEKNKRMAIDAQEEAQRMTDEAEKARMMAQQAAAEALEAETRALQAVADCEVLQKK